MNLRVNGAPVVRVDYYDSFHRARFDATMGLLRRYGGGRVVEVGGHPWAMTSRLIAERDIHLEATVSASEVTTWSDELPVTTQNYQLELDNRRAAFKNISANIERTLFPIGVEVDVVMACEIIEHLTRSPHIMMLNINGWLKTGGLVIITTPNGAQLENPFRVVSKVPNYRSSLYSRHNYLFSMDGLCDLVESCGFEVIETSFWSPFARRGLSKLRPILARLGPQYLKNKFGQTLCVVARKVETRHSASRMPKVYGREPGWECVEYPDDCVWEHDTPVGETVEAR